MSIEETFRDYDARIKAAGVNAKPADYFKAGYIFGGCAEIEKLADAPTPPAQEHEPLTRFCPSCGLLGEAGEQYRGCCPDGSDARMVPVEFAEKCHFLFNAALEAASTQKPVAWMYENTAFRPECRIPDDVALKARIRRMEVTAPWVETPLYTHPADDKLRMAAREAIDILMRVHESGERPDPKYSEIAERLQSALERARQ